MRQINWLLTLSQSENLCSDAALVIILRLNEPLQSTKYKYVFHDKLAQLALAPVLDRKGLCLSLELGACSCLIEPILSGNKSRHPLPV